MTVPRMPRNAVEPVVSKALFRQADEMAKPQGGLTEMSRVLHSSDCATHNAPALPPGPCDCGAEEAAV